MIVIKDKDPWAFLVGLFFDSWILMLCLGALGHILALHILFLSYWTAMLVIIIFQAIAPYRPAKLVVSYEDEDTN